MRRPATAVPTQRTEVYDRMTQPAASTAQRRSSNSSRGGGAATNLTHEEYALAQQELELEWMQAQYERQQQQQSRPSSSHGPTATSQQYQQQQQQTRGNQSEGTAEQRRHAMDFTRPDGYGADIAYTQQPQQFNALPMAGVPTTHRDRVLSKQVVKKYERDPILDGDTSQTAARGRTRADVHTTRDPIIDGEELDLKPAVARIAKFHNTTRDPILGLGEALYDDYKHREHKLSDMARLIHHKTRNPILEGDERVLRPGKRALVHQAQQSHIDTDEKPQRLGKAPPKTDANAAGVTIARREQKETAYQRCFATAFRPQDVLNTPEMEVRPHVPSRTLQPGMGIRAPTDPILQRDEGFVQEPRAATRTSGRVFTELAADQPPAQHKPHVRFLPQRSHVSTFSAFDERPGTAPAHDETVSRRRLGGLYAPKDNTDVINYRYSGGICPEERTIENRRQIQQKYEEELRRAHEEQRAALMSRMHAV